MRIYSWFLFGLTLFWVACGKESGDILTLETAVTATATPYLVLTGQDGNHRGLAVYDVNGNFVSGTNFRAEAITPRGLFPWSDTEVLMTGDTTDSIYRVGIDGTKTIFHGSAQFNGAIYDTVINTTLNLVYAIESNRIEVFDTNGVRQGSFLINTTVGGCTLSNPRGMVINRNGNLVVTNQGGADNILVYDISSTTATCVSSTAFGNNPWGVVQHSDGFLYIVTQGNDQVYRADPDGGNPTVIWSTNTAIINNPTGIVELPNGNLAVASSATDTVEQITTSGTRVGSVPFIRDTQSLNIGDLVIIGNTSGN